MITNKEIYQRVVHLIDDPDINSFYLSNIIDFQKTLYPFLVNGVGIITAPTSVSDILTQTDPPQGTMEIIEGNGGAAYSLTMPHIENCDVVCYIDGVPDASAVYNQESNSVQFSSDVPEGTKAAVEFYFAGGFTGDFSKIAGKFPVASLTERVKDLLAKATVIAWADKQKNFLLDIRNLLNDTDFKLHSPANALKSKMEWVDDLREEIFNLQNKLDWDLRNRNRSFYGY